MILGIDLGSEKNGTTQGVVLHDNVFEVLSQQGRKIVDVHDSIIQIIDEYKPEIITIDAPLSAPRGLHEVLAGRFGTELEYLDREVDKALRKDTGGSMPWCMISTISFKGIYIKNLVQKKYDGIEVLEVYPGTFAAGSGISKGKDETGYCRYVEERLKAEGFEINGDLSTHDIADAAVAALVGQLYKNENEDLGSSTAKGESVYYYKIK